MNHNALINSAFKEVRQCCQHLLQGYDRLNSSAPSNEDKQRFTKNVQCASVNGDQFKWGRWTNRDTHVTFTACIRDDTDSKE